MMLVDPKEDPCYVHVDILDDRVIFNPVYLRRLDSTFDFVSHVRFFSQSHLIGQETTNEILSWNCKGIKVFELFLKVVFCLIQSTYVHWIHWGWPWLRQWFSLKYFLPERVIWRGLKHKESRSHTTWLAAKEGYAQRSRRWELYSCQKGLSNGMKHKEAAR